MENEMKDEGKKLPNQTLPHFYNVSIIRTNAMKTFPNYFRAAQLEKLFAAHANLLANALSAEYGAYA